MLKDILKVLSLGLCALAFVLSIQVVPTPGNAVFASGALVAAAGVARC